MAISEAKKKRVWENSDRCCRYCHAPLTYKTMTIDHIVPQSSFKKHEDADVEENLCVACALCNSRKGSMSVKEFRKWINIRNNELLKLEAMRRSAIAQTEALSKQIEGRHFAYIHHLRKALIDNI